MRSAEEKKKVRSAGCGNYVPKPFSPSQILAKIHAIPVPSLALIAAVSLSLAQSGHRDALNQCPLLGVKRTSVGDAAMSAFDPKRTLATRSLRV
jgi:hypothetical protein